jgi:MarR family 2-MHQ and catechol resistance regulon transcriptional repressor
MQAGANQDRRDEPEDRVMRTALSYAGAFPEANLTAIETHLLVVSAGAAVSNGLVRHLATKGFEITRPRFTLLRLLYLSPEQRLPQTEIAQEMGVSSANVTQLIDALEREDWVERVINPSDRRVTYAKLTESGKERCSRLVPAILEFMEMSASALTEEEQTMLRNLLMKVRLHIRQTRYSHEAI